MVRMPDGRRARRRFSQESSLRAIKDWVDVELAKAHQQEQSLDSDPPGEGDGNDDKERKNGVGLTTAGAFLVEGYDLVRVLASHRRSRIGWC